MEGSPCFTIAGTKTSRLGHRWKASTVASSAFSSWACDEDSRQRTPFCQEDQSLNRFHRGRRGLCVWERDNLGDLATFVVYGGGPSKSPENAAPVCTDTQVLDEHPDDEACLFLPRTPEEPQDQMLAPGARAAPLPAEDVMHSATG